MNDNQNYLPNYSKYSLTELYDILNRIEKEKYPEKVKAINEQIELKKSLEENSYYKLFNKNLVVYKSRFFIWSLLILSFFILLNNLFGILFGNIFSFIYLIVVSLVLILILSNNKKQITAIKIYSVLLIIPTSFKLIALFLLIIDYLINSPKSVLQKIDKIISPANLLFPIMLITFAFGLYFLLTIKNNIIIRNVDQ